MTNSTSRKWIAGTVVVSLLISVAAWFLLIGPKRAEAADLEQQAVDTQATNQQLQVSIQQLEAQFAELPQRQAELAAIKQAMPEDPALPTLVRDLDDMADTTGVTLMSLSPGEPVALAQPAAATSAPADGGEATGQAAAADATATAPQSAGSMVLSVPVNLVVVGDFFKAELFLKQLQADLKRAFLVQTLSLQSEKEAEAGGGKPATKNGDVTMTVSGSVFVLKDAATASAAAPAAAGAGSAAPAPATPGQPATGTTTN